MTSNNVIENEDTSGFDELDPFDSNIEKTLEYTDWLYELQSGVSAHLQSRRATELSDCYRQTCAVWVHVSRSHQVLDLYENGTATGQWLVSTGVEGRETPNFDTHPNGRIYDRYTSTKFPGGDWNGLGNMPYAVFIDGGFALHGTGVTNWKYLGRPASHGCVRQHPDNALRLNRLVRQTGVDSVWITVED